MTESDSPSNKVLQDRRFSCRLAAHHRDLGQVDGVGDTELGEDILHPVHDGDEGLHARVTGHGELAVAFKS